MNPFFFTQLLSDDELYWWISMDRQQFYEAVQKYARPYMEAGGPRGRRRYVQPVSYIRWLVLMGLGLTDVFDMISLIGAQVKQLHSLGSNKIIAADLVTDLSPELAEVVTKTVFLFTPPIH